MEKDGTGKGLSPLLRGLVVVAAVLVAAGTVSPAFSAGGVTKKQVKKIVKKLAPGLSVAHAVTAGSADNLFAAQVDSSGTLLGSVPPGATSSRLGLGDYTVTFKRPVAGCVISASLGTNDPTFLLGEIEVAPYSLNPNALRVATATSAGALADRDFAAQMICPPA